MKRHGNLRSFLCGVLTSVLILSLTGTALASTLVNKELYFNNIKIRLNGTELQPKDANGKAVEPFIIDGTTYLPVRAVGEALGLNVSWDGATQTVILGNDAEKGQPAIWLDQLTSFEGKSYSYETNDINRADYKDGLANDGSHYDRIWYPLEEDYKERVTYLLKGQYSRFTGTFFLRENCKDGTNTDYNSAQMEIYLDDTLVFTSKELKPGSMPQDFSIDVSNAYKMEIRYSKVMETSYAARYSHQPQYTPIGDAALWTD